METLFTSPIRMETQHCMHTLTNSKGRLQSIYYKNNIIRKNVNVDLYFQRDEFNVKQGDTIALSGNSGSSVDHIFILISVTQNNFALDPLKVASFPEVPDKLPPAAEKIRYKNT